VRGKELSGTKFPFYFSLDPMGIRISDKIHQLYENGKGIFRAGEIRDELVKLFREYSELRKMQRAWVDNIMGPVFAAIDITYRCNLQCPYCFVSAGKRKNAPTISKQNFTRIVDLLADSGTLGICLCGGEPTLHPDLLEFISYAKDYGMTVNMVTNGTLINREFANRLAKAGIDLVQVSMDGSRAEIMDRLRGKGTYDRAISALQNLINNSIVTGIAFSATKVNISDFPNVVKMCAEIGVNRIRSMFLVPENEEHLKLIPSDEDYKKLVQWIQRNQVKYKSWIEFGDPTEHIVLGEFIGHIMISINPEGYILPSPYIALAYGNILKDDWLTLWDELQRVWSSNLVFNTILKYLRDEKDFLKMNRLSLNRNENEEILNVREIPAREQRLLANQIKGVLNDGNN